MMHKLTLTFFLQSYGRPGLNIPRNHAFPMLLGVSRAFSFYIYIYTYKNTRFLNVYNTPPNKKKPVRNSELFSYHYVGDVVVVGPAVGSRRKPPNVGIPVLQTKFEVGATGHSSLVEQCYVV